MKNDYFLSYLSFLFILILHNKNKRGHYNHCRMTQTSVLHQPHQTLLQLEHWEGRVRVLVYVMDILKLATPTVTQYAWINSALTNYATTYVRNHYLWFFEYLSFHNVLGFNTLGIIVNWHWYWGKTLTLFFFKVILLKKGKTSLNPR